MTAPLVSYGINGMVSSFVVPFGMITSAALAILYFAAAIYDVAVWLWHSCMARVQYGVSSRQQHMVAAHCQGIQWDSARLAIGHTMPTDGALVIGRACYGAAAFQR